MSQPCPPPGSNCPSCRFFEAGARVAFQYRVGERRPSLEGPWPEVSVGECDGRQSGLGIHPQEAPGSSEVTERRGRVSSPRPVRLLVVADLERQPPRVRVEPTYVGQRPAEVGALEAG